ncbi:hypothetical protein GCM10007853_26630 [Algimonas ampicilliniresistens]|jgi:uncharacterized membrane protein YhaH (DUF805 family)|uniref:DUF805 domain-containing protein n=1 Tax=Algimonas ampicilliniresistens TaxID=1298735 RepID=A0ABQ5VCQ0_9PROT|nr:DUF805 domain-containing protein [Algimonas ampicilliniresistens]GLQ24789.1 hypothetical protein GCM10007853_26630 [Algimonas ampicilliniresistens]
MGNLLFSPSGRIGPSAYMKGMIVLAVISAIISIIPLFSPGLAMILGLASIILIIPFVFLGIKRSHDAGKSGWMVLTHILLFIGVSVALTFILGALGLGPSPEMEAAVNAAGEAGDLGEVMRLSGEMAKESAIPGAVASLVGTLLSAYLINMFNKQDGGDNQYGPVPAA